MQHMGDASSSLKVSGAATGRDLSDTQLEDWRARALGLEAQVNGVVLGQSYAVRLLNIAVFSRGHVLLEGDVGVGKTTLLRAFARGIGGRYERVEGTVDLMPSDLIYHPYVTEDGQPRVAPGPVLKHGEALAIFFFNEINRARPHVHSLLLRVMAERTLSAFNREYHFPHLQVFADRNRVEKEETFEIPAAARDRFIMELSIDIPPDAELQSRLMLDPSFHDVDSLIDRVQPSVVAYDELNQVGALIQQAVRSTAALEDYAFNLCRATREPKRFNITLDDVDMSGLVLAGVSPRGMSMLMRSARVAAWLDGRTTVVPEDLHAVYAPCIAHRIFFSPVYELRRERLSGDFVAAILRHVSAP